MVTPITPLPTPVPQRNDATNFPTRGDALLAALPTAVDQINAVLAAMNLVAAGTAAAIPLVFDIATADADPTAGKLRLNQAVQNTATFAYIDLLSSSGADMTALIDAMDDSTNTADRGQIRVQNAADPAKFLIFTVTGAVTVVAGYRKIPISILAYSAASPFADTDVINLVFTRTGNKGADGTNMTSVADIQTFTGSGTWTKPAGTPRLVVVRALGPGGAGGSGARNAAAALRLGGAGGGGGAYVERFLQPGDCGATETVTIGAGGTGPAGATVNGNPGTVGPNGGNTTFGSLVTAYGGGGGGAGQVAANSAPGGGGGGGAGAGSQGSTPGTAANGGFPWGATTTSNNGTNALGEQGAGSSVAGGTTCNSERGGACGGSGSNGSNSSAAGGGSTMGGRGGGSGAGLNAANTNFAATAGGSNVYSQSGGGGGALGASGAAGTNGTAGTSQVTGQAAGTGGGGGGSGNAGAGGNGGNGGKGCGGGGGGGGTGGNGGAGGNGGDGWMQVITIF